MSQERINLGKKGEDLVVLYLRQHGFTIIAQNYRQIYGEIDIIAQKESILAFVEVKLRTINYCTLAELVPYSKQKKIIKTAQFFIAYNAHNYAGLDFVYRFDVAFLELVGPIGNDYHITYIPDAFRKEG